MNYLSSQAQAADFSERCSWDSLPSDMSNGMTIASESLPPESVTESCPMPLSSAISKHSSLRGTPQDIRAWLMSLPRVSPASHLVSPVSEKEPTTKGICGRERQPSLELSSPDSFCLKTCRESVPTCPWLSETCADLGMKFQDPSSSGLTTLGHRTGGKESGLWRTPAKSEPGISAERLEPIEGGELGGMNRHFDKHTGRMAQIGLTQQVALRKWWPTPTKQDGENNGGPSQYSQNTVPLNAAVHGGRPTLPTPSASMVTMQDMEQAKFAGSADRPKYADCPGGALNPEWVEWLMDVPIGFTDLRPLAICRFQAWWQAHGGF